MQNNTQTTNQVTHYEHAKKILKNIALISLIVSKLLIHIPYQPIKDLALFTIAPGAIAGVALLVVLLCNSLKKKCCPQAANS